ncbi:threonine synthase [Biomaibacter acetigenes]|uniref:Threonine synthase n=1 Tax=Biomaibacter acetigenes TaxID=2316383 RepID=A0A3G2R1A8_9FIRM|nr:threonine synthase [Biomaibacter acetigenes]AYO29210.1 threonine synthase [Biomaibacter acetigenes]
MKAIYMKCVKCGNQQQLSQNYSCKQCGGILQIQYDYSNSEIRKKSERIGLLKYADYLPVNAEYFVTLGEGDTPLLKANHLGRWLGLKKLYLKDEGCNPTGSFKDRSVAVGISKTLEFGANTIIIASSGNGGASAAAYAAKAGLRAVVIVPADTPINKVNQAIMYGAQVIKVEGPYSNSYHVAKKAAENYGWVNLTTTFINPYIVEGNKTIAYEIVESLGWTVPNWIVVPVGDGPVLVGIWRGFMDLKAVGAISRLPKIAAVQAERCAPIVRAFENGKDTVDPWTMGAGTIASGIADTLDGYSEDGTLTLKCIRESEGYAVSLSEEEIWESVVTLARAEGVFAEPTGAVSVIGMRKMIAQGLMTSNETVVAIITGNGLKTPHLPPNYSHEPQVVKDADELNGLILERNCLPHAI